MNGAVERLRPHRCTWQPDELHKSRNTKPETLNPTPQTLRLQPEPLTLKPDTLHRVSSNPLGSVDPSFRALSGRLKLTVRRHKFNKDYLSTPGSAELRGSSSAPRRPSHTRRVAPQPLNLSQREGVREKEKERNSEREQVTSPYVQHVNPLVW